jgi:glyoxylase-like metal-dependent hydrolase (beta-lactamase superfamily II)
VCSDRCPPAANATSRRAVLQGIAGGLAGLSLAPLAREGRAAGASIATTVVAPDIKLMTGAGGNIVVLSTDAGQVLVDSGAAGANEAVLAALRGLPGGKVAALFNTHWHLDQVGGNESLGLAGATIIAHEKTRQRLTAGYYLPHEDRWEKPLPAAARPTKTFYTTDETAVGNRRIEYGYLIAAHTDGDIYVSFKDANVIAVGDVVSPQRDPALDWFGGGWLGGRLDALEKLLALGNQATRYVPSYGPVVGRAQVQAEYDLMKQLFDLFVVHIRLGESADDMLKAGVMNGLPRKFEDPHKFLYDAHKGFWAHHNKLMPDIV